MPRDLPPIALPALAFSEAQAGALRYGGYPRLPEGCDWPLTSEDQPMHHFAQIDLSALPRGLTQAERPYALPAFPDSGMLFLFFALDGDTVYNQTPVVIHAPDADSATPERYPPTPLPPLNPDAAFAFHPENVAADGCSLKPGFMTATPFLSARAENPLWRNMDRTSMSEDELFARDLAYAKQLRALGIDHPLPLAAPAATQEPFFQDIPEIFRGFFQRGVFQFDWPYVFEVAKVTYAQCQQLPVDELEDWIHHGDDQPRYHKLIARFKAQRQAILAQTLEGRAGLWERFSCDHVPSLDMRVDVQLRRWMGYARLMQGRGPMAQADKLAFVALLRLIDRKARAGGAVNLKALRHFKEHNVRNDYVRMDMVAAFEHTAQALHKLHPERPAAVQNDYGDADQAARNVQMFGAGYLLQTAAVQHEDKVLLFQLSDAGGLFFEDGIVQLWITPDDLAAGRFDRVISTMECT